MLDEKESLSTDELIRRDLIDKKKKELRVSETYLEVSISNKKKLLDEMLAKIETTKTELQNLEETLAQSKKEILDQIDERRRNAEVYERKAKETAEFNQRERNFIEQEKSNVLGKRVELENLIGQYTEKLNRIRVFCESLK